MGRIKHPDTFTCDICGRDLDYLESVHSWPVITHCNEVANEYGIKVTENKDYDFSSLYLCQDCLSKIAVVQKHPVFYGPSTYELDGDDRQ